jgi:ribosome-associated toxin RatA of RatAB toxin-antitoxin module
MKHVKKSVLLWYSAREMYDLVVDVEHYPSFLPWCDSAAVIERHGPGDAPGSTDGMTARLGLNYAGVRQAFTTRNDHVEGRQVRLELVDGPFSKLLGTWDFVSLSPAGHGGDADAVAEAAERACRIEFDLAYAFKAGPLEIVLNPVFDRIANTFVDSFVKRASQVYGER